MPRIPDLRQARRLLCVQPHYDDNDIGAGGTIAALACLVCFFKFVRTRKKLLGEEPIDEEELVRIRNRFGIFSFSVLNPALLVALGVGFWLAHQRAIEAFVR